MRRRPFPLRPGLNHLQPRSPDLCMHLYGRAAGCRVRAGAVQGRRLSATAGPAAAGRRVSLWPGDPAGADPLHLGHSFKRRRRQLLHCHPAGRHLGGGASDQWLASDILAAARAGAGARCRCRAAADPVYLPGPRALAVRLEKMVGERGFEPPAPTSRT